MNHSGGVYYIKNLVNNKLYIGSSVDIQQRIAAHKTELRNGKHKNNYLQNSWNKYGEDSFEFGIIEEIDASKEDLRDVEQYYMDYFDVCNRENGFNISCDAERYIPDEFHKKMRSIMYSKEKNPFYGKHHTSQTKEIIRQSKLGLELNDNQRKALELGRGTKYWTNETYDKLRSANRGEKSGTAKLKEKDVIQILQMIKDGFTQKYIAEKFEVKISEVSRIKNRKRWGSYL